jgi:hypothetical protein
MGFLSSMGCRLLAGTFFGCLKEKKRKLGCYAYSSAGCLVSVGGRCVHSRIGRGWFFGRFIA